MSWRDDWRRQAHDWIRRLNALALEWHQLDLRGVRSARDRRKAALRVRDWMYEIIDIYLGGIEALPNKVPTGRKTKRKTKGGELGALATVLVAGGVAVTVASIGAWILNEEQRVIEAKAKLVRAIGDEARKATDPEVARKIAGVAERLDPNASKGPSWLWLAPLVVAVPLLPAIIKRVKAQARERLAA